MNYILLGPEEGQKSDWLENEKKRVLKEHPDAEILQIYVGDDKGDDLDAALSQPSLFSSFRFVIIKQYENRSAKDTFDKAIMDFLSSGLTDAEFVIISSEKSQSRIRKEIIGSKNVSVIMFWEMFDSQKKDWIKAAFQKEGFYIGAEAIDEVLFSVDNNIAEMRNLVSALSLYFHSSSDGKTEITTEDIRKYALQTRGEDGLTLFQAIADGDLEHAESIASSIILSDSTATGRAFQTVIQRFRQLESFEILKASGNGEEYAFQNADSLSPYPVFYPTKGIKKKDWPLFRKAAQRYPLKDTSRIIGYLGRMDRIVKSTGSEWTGLLFSSILCTVMIDKGREEDFSLSDNPLAESI